MKSVFGGKRRRVTPDAHRRVECPLCGRAMSEQLVSAHIDLDHAEPPPPLPPPKRVRTTDAANVAAVNVAAVNIAAVSVADANVAAADVANAVAVNDGGCDECDETVAAADLAEHKRLVHSAPTQAAVQAVTVLQPSIHSFWGGADYTVPPCFVMEWTNEYGPVAYFARKPPAESRWQGTFEWREHKRAMLLVSNIAPARAEQALAPETFYHSVPLLKSHLQKCVRRSHATLAVQTALTLLRMDVGELLRRLPIIVIEDVQLMPMFTSLVWLMAAQAKGFQLPVKVMEWVLGAVHRTATCSTMDVRSARDRAPALARKAVADLPRDRRDLLYAIQLRRAFGGMAGDMLMLNWAIEVWLARFSDPSFEPAYSTVFSGEPVKPIAITSIEPLLLSQWEPAAIDFHCSNILERMSETNVLAGLSEQQLKSMMWNYGSATTNKTRVAFAALHNAISGGDDNGQGDTEAKRAWQAAERDIHVIARSILQQRH